MLKKSFTLVEVMIVMVIIIIMAVVMTSVLAGREGERDLFFFREELIADLRYTQFRSMNTDVRYGIYIKHDQIFLFRDLDRKGDFDVGERIEIIKFENVTFSPFLQTIIFNKYGGIPSDVSITIQGIKNLKISINSIGLIRAN